MLMSVAAGATVANIYYNQPILKEIAQTFQINETSAGLVSILSQVGYGLGLFFITPLGDKIDKRKLIISLQVLLLISLFFITVSQSIIQVWILSVLISVFSVSVQVILPMAAGLDRENRGKTVGTIFTGILIGILAARVFSGSVAEWFGCIGNISWGDLLATWRMAGCKQPNVALGLNYYLDPSERTQEQSNCLASINYCQYFYSDYYLMKNET